MHQEVTCCSWSLSSLLGHCCSWCASNPWAIRVTVRGGQGVVVVVVVVATSTCSTIAFLTAILHRSFCLEIRFLNTCLFFKCCIYMLYTCFFSSSSFSLSIYIYRCTYHMHFQSYTFCKWNLRRLLLIFGRSSYGATESQLQGHSIKKRTVGLGVMTLPKFEHRFVVSSICTQKHGFF